MLLSGVALMLFFQLIVGGNVTDDSYITGWKAEPSTRGTFGLAWSCLATLIVCTWTAQRLNLPAEEDTEFRIIRRKLAWTLSTVLCPEWLAACAIDEHFYIRRQIKKWSQINPDNPAQRWTMGQGFFVACGGLIVSYPSLHYVNEQWKSFPRHQQSKQSDGYKPTEFIVRLQGVPKLIEQGLISTSSVSNTDIRDRSKADDLAKALACTQSGWLILQCIARKAQNLPISLLELTCLAYIGLAILTYGLWWEKPMDVRTPIILPVLHRSDLWIKSEAYQPRTPQSRIEYTSLIVDDEGANVFFYAGAAFGAWHALAWNFSFPTCTERNLWRVASISSCAIPLVLLVMLLINYRYDSVVRYIKYFTVGKPLSRPASFEPTKMPHAFCDSIIVGIFFVYTSIRLFILVEMFASLRSMPVGVYQNVAWVKYIPHI